MALTEGDKAECKEIARVIVNEVLKYHIASCPYGLALAKSKMLMVGLCIGSGLASGTTVFALVKFLTGAIK